MTTTQNQSGTETLTTAVFTAIEASQKLTDALKAIAQIVSTDESTKQTTTTDLPGAENNKVKKSSGRTRKTKQLDPTVATEATTKDSEAQDLGTTSTTRRSGLTKLGEAAAESLASKGGEQEGRRKTTDKSLESAKPADPAGASVPSGVEQGTKKRGASRETLAKARAALAASRARRAAEKSPPVAVPSSGWPFPTSTKYNNDGTSKETTSSHN